MGRMKETLMSFCEAIYPEDYDKQDKLFQDMMHATGDPIQNPSIASFRRMYETARECPTIDLADMSRIVEQFEANVPNSGGP